MQAGRYLLRAWGRAARGEALAGPFAYISQARRQGEWRWPALRARTAQDFRSPAVLQRCLQGRAVFLIAKAAEVRPAPLRLSLEPFAPPLSY